MRNDSCDLPPEEIERLPEEVLGILLSPFQFTVEWGMCAFLETRSII
jgi:hypothetical protein